MQGLARARAAQRLASLDPELDLADRIRIEQQRGHSETLRRCEHLRLSLLLGRAHPSRLAALSPLLPPRAFILPSCLRDRLSDPLASLLDVFPRPPARILPDRRRGSRSYGSSGTEKTRSRPRAKGGESYGCYLCSAGHGALRWRRRGERVRDDRRAEMHRSLDRMGAGGRVSRHFLSFSPNSLRLFRHFLARQPAPFAVARPVSLAVAPGDLHRRFRLHSGGPHQLRIDSLVR